jgi:hypothetical protein
LLHRDFFSRLLQTVASDITENVNTAKFFVKQAINAIELLVVRHVAGDGNGPPPQLRQGMCRGFIACGINIQQHQMRPRLGKSRGHGQAHPAGGTGDKRDAIC